MKKAILLPDTHSQRALFFHVRQFNLLPTRYIHESWLNDLLGALQTDIRPIWQKNSRAEKHCAALIIKTFCHGFIFDFSDAIRCVALMPSDALARLMIYAGLVINAHFIMKTISGHYIQSLSNAFGPQAYEFAATRAPLLFGSRRLEFLTPSQTHMDPQPGDILECGRQCLQICLEGSPEALTQRFRLKFPRNMRWDFAPRSEEAVRMACRRIVEKIMKMEIRPPWNTVLP
jgi:hypothetical protein